MASSDELMNTALYDRLHAIAQARFRGFPDDAGMQPTALLHETYLKLSERAWESEEHFVRVFAMAAFQILVDIARSRSRERRGGRQRRVELAEIQLVWHDPAGHAEEFLLLEEAMEALREYSPDAADTVLLHFFFDLDAEVISTLMGVGEPAVRKRIRTARLWLYRHLSRSLSQHD